MAQLLIRQPGRGGNAIWRDGRLVRQRTMSMHVHQTNGRLVRQRTMGIGTSDKWSTCTTKDNGYRYIRQMVDLYDKGQWVGTSDTWSTWKTKDNGYRYIRHMVDLEDIRRPGHSFLTGCGPSSLYDTDDPVNRVRT